MRKDPAVVVTLPEIGRWDSISGFSFTRSKGNIFPTVEAVNYLDSVDVDKVSIESIKRDRLYVFDVNDFRTEHSVYKCLYFEVQGDAKSSVIFGGVWYEVENSFMARINEVLDLIPISTLEFPAVKCWEKNGEPKIESEGDYNARAAQEGGYYLP